MLPGLGNRFADAPESDKPALQWGVDYSHDAGWYLGYWASQTNYSYRQVGKSYDQYADSGVVTVTDWQDGKSIEHGMASPLHDIGKVAIPVAILHKPGKLTQEEWEIMKKHVDYGVEILGNSKRSIMRKAAEIIGFHHEKWNGTGYPNGIAGLEIPIAGRITALADVFDALGGRRSYKEPWPLDRILTLLQEERGQHFDPDLVDLLFADLDRFIGIKRQHPDELHSEH